MSKYNPMAISTYSYKVEFQLRGAAHIHGILWIDWNRCNALPNEIIVNDDGEEVVINHMLNVRSLMTDIKRGEIPSEEKLRSAALFADKFVTFTF